MVSHNKLLFQVMEVVLASTFIPIFSGWVPPRYRGTRVIGRFRDRKIKSLTSTLALPSKGNKGKHDDILLCR